jgi:hypothetical protein
LYKAKIQLPNSINAYLKQYKLTKINWSAVSTE